MKLDLIFCLNCNEYNHREIPEKFDIEIYVDDETEKERQEDVFIIIAAFKSDDEREFLLIANESEWYLNDEIDVLCYERKNEILTCDSIGNEILEKINNEYNEHIKLEKC